MSRRYSRSLLPHYLAALCALAIVYSSLQPFSPWIPPEPGTRFFLFAPGPLRWFPFDGIANALAYLPFGFFVALVPRSRPPLGRMAVACAAGAALSFAMESLQMYLPPRDASVVDLAANTVGAVIGGALAGVVARSSRTAHGLARLRDHWFLHGRAGDFGIALVTVWLAAQVNPGIPLFAIMYDPTPQLGPVSDSLATAPDLAATLVEAAHSAFQLLGVGLFVALLLRDRRYVGGAVLVLIGLALLVKGIAAAVLLKPNAWEHWLSPGVSTGVAAGALALLVTIWAPRPVQVALAAIALLSSLLATLLAPGLVHANAPLSLFNWSYGHLLNFNGLTHTVLLVWPIVASAFLFTLAGRPGWGDPK
jgi:VanZ family protein